MERVITFVLFAAVNLVWRGISQPAAPTSATPTWPAEDRSVVAYVPPPTDREFGVVDIAPVETPERQPVGSDRSGSVTTGR